MKITKLPIPDGEYCTDPEDIDDWQSELDRCDYGHQVVKIEYWYALGDYEGAGEATLTLDDGRTATFSLSHCSCYGPLDDMPRTYLAFGGGIAEGSDMELS